MATSFVLPGTADEIVDNLRKGVGSKSYLQHCLGEAVHSVRFRKVLQEAFRRAPNVITAAAVNVREAEVGPGGWAVLRDDFYSRLATTPGLMPSPRRRQQAFRT